MKKIKSARSTLIFVGVLTMIASVAFYFLADSTVEAEINEELRKLRQQNTYFHADPGTLQELEIAAVKSHRLGAMISFGEGVVFLLLGLFVEKAPVALTATGLILYVADYAIGGIFDPTYLYKGIIIKIFIVSCLVKALNAAIAYEKERRRSGATTS